ncbi:hypothetical protein [Arcicella lustrica]|uniref:Uncharacterized protein n=1 Tax=Arcicella lustrica TaxID=2984196 RepID=A0ABU5SHP4_9BACT|nr:hypothetical protein [Arcicella sp. DC25W]MEA5426799.1 hypothetical protein [Arcicella sp. DC25W]
METLFNISNHPAINGFTRKVQVVGPYVDFVQKTVVCPIDIKHYQNELLSENYIPTQRVALMTSNEKFVDALGQRVELVEEQYFDQQGVEQTRNVPPVGAVPEFDFLFSYVSQTPNQTLGDTILEVLHFMIARNDQAGNFNDLSNFNS